MDLYPQEIFLLSVVLFLLLSGCLPAIRTKFSIVARINGSFITDSDMMEELKQFHFQQFQSGRSKGDHPDMEKFLETVVDKKLVVQEARRVKLEKESEFQEAAQKDSKLYEEKVLYGLFFEKIIKPQVQITNQEMEQYYHDHPSLFKRGDMVFLEQIEIKDMDLANQIHQDLIQGADFAFSGKENPADGTIRYSKEWIQLQQMRPEVRKQVSSLMEGEISSPFHYGYHYYIFRVKRKKAGSLIPFDMAKKRIEKELAAQKFRSLAEDSIRRLREASQIIIYHDNVQKLISGYQP